MIFILKFTEWFFQLFDAEKEKALVEYILNTSDIYYGLSISELKSLANEYAKNIHISYPSSWNENRKASADWYCAFMRVRYPSLSLRMPEQVSANRAKSFYKENVDVFFNNLSIVLNEMKEAKKALVKQRKVSPQSTELRKNQRPYFTSTEEEDVDFCIICMENMPKNLTQYNFVNCNMCNRAVHLKCANIRASYFTCANCESE